MYQYICCCTQCPRPCSRPPLTCTSAGDSRTLRASLGESLVGSLLLSRGSWCIQGSVCALQESVSRVRWLCGGVNKRTYAIPRSAASRAPALWQSTVDLYLCRRHSDTVLAQSLWHLWVLVGTRFV